MIINQLFLSNKFIICSETLKRKSAQTNFSGLLKNGDLKLQDNNHTELDLDENTLNKVIKEFNHTAEGLIELSSDDVSKHPRKPQLTSGLGLISHRNFSIRGCNGESCYLEIVDTKIPLLKIPSGVYSFEFNPIRNRLD